MLEAVGEGAYRKGVGASQRGRAGRAIPDLARLVPLPGSADRFVANIGRRRGVSSPMTLIFPRSLCAAVAVSAALTLGSTPGAAQDAAPTMVLPVAPPAPAPAPAPATISSPVVQAVPPRPAAAASPAEAAAEPAARPAPRREPARSAERLTERATERSAATVPSPAAAEAPETPAVAPIAAAAPVIVPTPTEAAPAPQPAAERSGLGVEEGLLVALLGALGLAGVGFLALRRRREDDEDELLAEAPLTAAAAAAPIVATPAAAPAAFPTGLRQLADPNAAFAMPAGPVPTGAAREALLDRMVTADPDEANPFGTPKARRRRARLLLQQREAELSRDARTPFDWRTYDPAAHKDGVEPEEAGQDVPLKV